MKKLITGGIYTDEDGLCEIIIDQNEEKYFYYTLTDKLNSNHEIQKKLKDKIDTQNIYHMSKNGSIIVSIIDGYLGTVDDEILCDLQAKLFSLKWFQKYFK